MHGLGNGPLTFVIDPPSCERQFIDLRHKFNSGHREAGQADRVDRLAKRDLPLRLHERHVVVELRLLVARVDENLLDVVRVAFPADVVTEGDLVHFGIASEITMLNLNI